MIKSCIKVSFTGDLMCELPLLRERKGDGFKNIGIPIKDIYKSDYVVSNLETVFAGKELNFTNDVYSFNTPDSFVDVINDSQIDLVSTANNHCLDRGVSGLTRTLNVLDKNKIGHTGTFHKNESENFFVKSIDGINFGFISYTYGTNYAINKNLLNDDEFNMVNLLKPQNAGFVPRTGVFNKIKDNIFRTETKIKLKKIFGIKYNVPRIDHLKNDDIDDRYLSRFEESLIRAKSQCQFLFVLLHSGGQFNRYPGEYTSFIVDKIHSSVDCNVIGNHPHIVQKATLRDEKFTAYSLGNYLISKESEYIIFDNLPEFSVILHFYINEDGIKKISYSVVFIGKDENNKTKIYDTFMFAKNNKVSKDYINNVKIICETFEDRKFDREFELKEEYDFYSCF